MLSTVELLCMSPKHCRTSPMSGPWFSKIACFSNSWCPSLWHRGSAYPLSALSCSVYLNFWLPQAIKMNEFISCFIPPAKKEKEGHGSAQFTIRVVFFWQHKWMAFRGHCKFIVFLLITAEVTVRLVSAFSKLWRMLWNWKHFLFSVTYINQTQIWGSRKKEPK